MMWGFYGGWDWLWMSAVMVLFWGGIVALIVFAIRALTGPRGGDQAGDQALDVVRRRLASGEISQEEFDRIRRALQGS